MNSKRGRPPKCKINNDLPIIRNIPSATVPNNIHQSIVLNFNDVSDDDQPTQSSVSDIKNSTIDDTSFVDNENNNNDDSHLKKIIHNQNILIEKLRKKINDSSNTNIHSQYTSQLMKNIETKNCNLHLINYTTQNTITLEPTDICCWWCTEPFTNLPCFLPQSNINNIFYVFGCFCSYNCAYSYNISLNDSYTTTRTRLLNNLCKILFNNNDIILIPAPKKEILKKYGGTLTIEQYRNPFVQSHSSFAITIPPIIELSILITETPKNIC